jgi:hypothetical protein
MKMMDKKIVAILVGIILILVIGGYQIYQQHQTDINLKLNHQANYPYSCVVSDQLWDTCAYKTTILGGNAWAFNENRTCMQVYYATIEWDNHQVFTFDSDGIIHYKSQIYDSNNVWHESSTWRTCP